MKKILLTSLFLLSSLSVLAERYVVNTKDGYANLRREANSKSEVIERLKNNDEMVLWGKNGDWYSVGVINKYPDEAYVDGYIHKSQVKLHPDTYVISSKDGYANVRNEAAVNSDSIKQLKNNTVVTKLEEKGDWFLIEYDEQDGTPFDYGYVHKSQLKKK